MVALPTRVQLRQVGRGDGTIQKSADTCKTHDSRPQGDVLLFQRVCGQIIGAATQGRKGFYCVFVSCEGGQTGSHMTQAVVARAVQHCENTL